jgi:hypothetical protein
MSADGYPQRGGTNYTRPRLQQRVATFGSPEAPITGSAVSSATVTLPIPVSIDETKVTELVEDGADSVGSSASALMANQALLESRTATKNVAELSTKFDDMSDSLQSILSAIDSLHRSSPSQGQTVAEAPHRILQPRTVDSADAGAERLFGGAQRIPARVTGMARSNDLSEDEQHRAARLLEQANQVDPARAFTRTPGGGYGQQPASARAFMRVGLASVEDNFTEAHQDAVQQEMFADELRARRRKIKSEPVFVPSFHEWAVLIHKSAVLTPFFRGKHGDAEANACVYHCAIVQHLATRPGKSSGWPLAAAYDRNVIVNWMTIDFAELCTSVAYLTGDLDQAVHFGSYAFAKDKLEREAAKVAPSKLKWCSNCNKMVMHKAKDCRGGAPQSKKEAAPGPSPYKGKEEKKHP